MNNRFTSLHTLALAILVIAAGSKCVAQERDHQLGHFEFNGDSIALPMINQNGHLKANVDFGDGVARSFIVDTGASVNVIDSGVAESFGYEVIDEIEIGAPGGPQIPANVVKVPLAHVGDGTIVDAEFVTMDMVGFSGGSTLGVIGMGLFRDYLLTFDYGQSEIRVSRESLSAGSAGVMPYEFTNNLIHVDLNVAGTTVKSHIDTGSMGGFTLPVEIRESLPLLDAEQSSIKAHVVGGDRDIQFKRLDGDILFAGTTYENPEVALIDPSTGFGNVGSRILAEYMMSVDQAKQLIRFQKLMQRPVADAGNTPRRLGVQFRGMPGGTALTIGRVDSGSLAEQSGLLPGDVLVKLNDKATEEYDMPALGKLFRSTEPLRFDIDRGGQLLAIEID
jgi:predicted aspartyl protease